MTNVAIIRCEKNMEKCPLTNCLRCLKETKEGFAPYEECNLTGIFSCRCPGDISVDLAQKLQKKGAEVIHFCTCTFAKKTSQGWLMKNGGFCKNIDTIIENIENEVGIKCIKGTAHLPKDY